MDKQALDDGLWMFEAHHRDDIAAGIERARGTITDSGNSPRPVGYYSNLVNRRISEISPYLESSYRTASGEPLGSNGRRELICAICLNEDAAINTLL